MEKLPNDASVNLGRRSLDQAVSSTYYKMGQCYIKLEQFDKALESFEKTIELNPNDLNSYYNVAEFYFYIKHLKEIIEFTRNRLKRSPILSTATSNSVMLT